MTVPNVMMMPCITSAAKHAHGGSEPAPRSARRRLAGRGGGGHHATEVMPPNHSYPTMIAQRTAVVEWLHAAEDGLDHQPERHDLRGQEEERGHADGDDEVGEEGERQRSRMKASGLM